MILHFDNNVLPGAVETAEHILKGFDLTVTRVRMGEQIALATSGDERTLPWSEIESLPCIVAVIKEPPAFYFTSRKFKETPSVIKIGDVPIGGNSPPVVIAGPCAVENREDTLATAAVLKAMGITIFRAGIFKPRTTPYNFQGIGRKGLEILNEVRETYGLAIVTEVLDPDDIPVVAQHCDAIQVGTRNMTNSALLKRLGGASKPVVLKRSFAARVEELVRAAEFVTVYGNPDVILCERGIQTVETYTRYTLDLAAVVAIKELSHLPVIVDPSHGTGRPSFIPIMSKAAIIVGADGLIIESHVAPERMIKPGDDFQALRPPQLEQLLSDLKPLQDLVRGRL